MTQNQSLTTQLAEERRLSAAQNHRNQLLRHANLVVEAGLKSMATGMCKMTSFMSEGLKFQTLQLMKVAIASFQPTTLAVIEPAATDMSQNTQLINGSDQSIVQSSTASRAPPTVSADAPPPPPTHNPDSDSEHVSRPPDRIDYSSMGPGSDHRVRHKRRPREGSNRDLVFPPAALELPSCRTILKTFTMYTVSKVVYRALCCAVQGPRQLTMTLTAVPSLARKPGPSPSNMGLHKHPPTHTSIRPLRVMVLMHQELQVD